MSAHLLGIDIGTSSISLGAVNALVVALAGYSAVYGIPSAVCRHAVFAIILTWV